MKQYVKEKIKSLIYILFIKSGFPIRFGGKYWVLFHPKHFRWFSETYEKSQFLVIDKIKNYDGVAIDVGAHFGLYSLIIAKYLVKKVIAFEPTPYSVEIFKRNSEYNRVSKLISINQMAVGAKNSKQTFHVQETEGAVSNSLVDYWHSDEMKKKIEVRVISLDSFIKEKVSFIKIDAEGFEFDVLVGAKRIIRNYFPVIFLALHPDAIKAKGDDLIKIWLLIEDFGYCCYSNGKKIGKEDFVNQTDLFDVILSYEKI